MTLSRPDASTLARKIQQGDRVVVKFTAQWCGPCKAYAPVVEAAAQAHPGIDFVEVDLDTHPDMARQWRVRSIPNTLGFRDGKLVFQAMGALPRAALEKHLEALS